MTGRAKPPGRRRGEYGRPSPKYANSPERRARPAEEWRGRQHVELVLKCGDCGGTLARYQRDTWEGASADVLVISDHGTVPAIEEDRVLLTCRRCLAEPDYPVARIEDILAEMYQPGRIASVKVSVTHSV